MKKILPSIKKPLRLKRNYYLRLLKKMVKVVKCSHMVSSSIPYKTFFNTNYLDPPFWAGLGLGQSKSKDLLQILTFDFNNN